jgi:hypothetical protein
LQAAFPSHCRCAIVFRISLMVKECSFSLSSSSSCPLDQHNHIVADSASHRSNFFVFPPIELWFFASCSYTHATISITFALPSELSLDGLLGQRVSPWWHGRKRKTVAAVERNVTVCTQMVVNLWPGLNTDLLDGVRIVMTRWLSELVVRARPAEKPPIRFLKGYSGAPLGAKLRCGFGVSSRSCVLPRDCTSSAMVRNAACKIRMLGERPGICLLLSRKNHSINPAVYRNVRRTF